MLQRCTNRRTPNWHLYGGRGITVCERWRTFENFLSDMGERPPGTSIDRIDNDGDYEPDNCRWGTEIEQASNRRTNRMLTLRGKTQSLSQWARELGMPHGAIRSRLAKGWDPEEALTRPYRALKTRPHFRCGHPRTPDNIYTTTRLSGERAGKQEAYCRACAAQRKAGKPTVQTTRESR